MTEGFITNQTNITMDKVMELANFTTPADFMVRVNQTVYSGLFWIIMLWLLFIVGIMIAHGRRPDRFLQHVLFSGAICTVLGFLMRAVTAVIDGVRYSMISDHQMWVFPILTLIVAAIVWATKERS
jgi:hypothetical protein